MGFYGNIKNTARTQFYFDRIYPNRVSMDTNASKDNIFAGRYVLVEYEQDISQDDFAHYYYYGGNMYTEMVSVPVKMALDSSIETIAFEGGVPGSLVRADSASDGTICCVLPGQHIRLMLDNDMYIQFTDSRGGYKVTDKTKYDEFYRTHSSLKEPNVYIINNKMYTQYSFIGGQFAVIRAHRNYETSEKVEYWRSFLTSESDIIWESVSSGDSAFQRNFNIDKGTYVNEGRTYDSTVWQKVYVGNQEKYIMIADLNTITPTFSFTADAPTVTPVPIHYDPNNTNTNYNIHMQGPWGFRVKGASGNLKVPAVNHNGKIDENFPSIDASKSTITYPSDFTTKWKGSFYDVLDEEETEKYYSPYTNKWNGLNNNISSMVPSAIYVNKNGFDPKTISKSKDIVTAGSPYFDPNVNATITDDISISPSGYSGRMYNDHLNNEGYDPQPDTQELTLMLPSIGDAVSNMWDMVYGGRDTDETIKKTNVRNLSYEWEYANNVIKRAGLRSITDNLGHFNSDSVNTLAGCINSTHDLMGMIILKDADYLNLSEYEDGYIYQFKDGTYRRKTTKYNYTNELKYNYKEIGVSELTYLKGYFYNLVNGKYEVCEDDAFNRSKVYYTKTITIPERYEKVTNLADKPNFTIYYRTPLDEVSGKYNYRVVHDIAEDINYYKLVNETPIKVTAFYEPYSFYYAVGDTKLELDVAEKATENRTYFVLNQNSVSKPVNQSLENPSRYLEEEEQYVLDYSTITGKPTLTTDLKYIYYPGYFYRMTSIINENNKEIKTITKEERPYSDVAIEISKIGKTDIENGQSVKHYGYYIMQGSKKQGDNEGSWVQNPDGSFTTSDDITNLVDVKMYKVTLLPWRSSYYYIASPKKLIPSFTDGLKYDDDDEVIVEDDESVDNSLLPTYVKTYTYVTQENLKEAYEKEFTYDESTAVYTKFYVATFEDAGTFYTKNMFYFKTQDGSYAIDTLDTMTEGRNYFSDVSFTVWEGKKFYIPNKYYIVDSITGNYILDKTLTFDSNKTYYKFNGGVYVMSDSMGILAPHSEWNKNITQVPASVRVCLRDEVIGTEVMPSFARGLNTLHGMILRINQILEIENFDTRDRTTLQGCINQINDIINKFNILEPNNFIVVDDYGRVNNAHWDNLQKISSGAVKTSNDEKVLSEGLKEDQYKEVSSLNDMRGQWLTLCMDSSPGNPTFSIHHNFQKVTDTTSVSNRNSDGKSSTNATDKISLYTPIVDAMGHVVGKNIETVTLPYGFKTIASNGSNEAVTGLTSSNANIIANNTQDKFTFNTGNKWIITATNNNTMTIAHAVSEEVADIANQMYGLEQDETIDVLDSDNEFEVPVFKFDEAGHITFADTHKVKIPEVFTDIKITGGSTNTDNTSSTSGTITADSLTDTLNFAAGNKWIQMSHDAATDTITFKHYVNKFTEGTAATDLDSSQTFTVQELSWDNAGHLIGSTKRTYTIQDGWKNLAIANSGANTVTIPTGAAGTLTATTHIDTATIDTSNKWITLIANGKTVTIGHAAASTAKTSKGDTANKTPSFGSTFKVLSAGIDETGHVSSLADHTVKIPLPSLSTTYVNTTLSTGNVLVDMTLVDTTGVFTQKKANVGTLALTEYTAPTTSVTGTVAASDTINSAFSKVQSYLGSLTNRINSLDFNAIGGDAYYLSAISQTNGQISATSKAIITSISSTSTNTALVSPKAVYDFTTGLINGLDVADNICTDGQVVSKVKQVDGKIAVTTKTLTASDIPSLATSKITSGTFDAARIPDLSGTYITKTATFAYTDGVATEDLTVEQLVEKVATLEARIKALEPTI